MYFNFDFTSLSKDSVLAILHLYYTKDKMLEKLEVKRKKIIKGSFSKSTADAIKEAKKWQSDFVLVDFLIKSCHKALDFIKSCDIILLQRLGSREKIPNDFNGYSPRQYFRRTNEAFRQFGYHVCKQGVNDKMLENFGDFFKNYRNAVKQKYLLRTKEHKNQNEE